MEQHIRRRTRPSVGRWPALHGAVLAAAALAALLVAACGGNAPGASTTSTSTGGSGGGGSSGTYALTLSLVDSTGTAVTQLNAGQSATAIATLTNNGAAVSGQLVNLTQSSGATPLVNLQPLNASLPTSSSGSANFTVTANGLGGGGVSLTASASVGGQNVTQSLAFTVGQSATTGLTIATFKTINGTGAATIGSYGTTGLVATVTTSAGAAPSSPVTVNFAVAGACAASGAATVTASAVTSLIAGVATANATFSDNGCASAGGQPVPVVISASLASASPPYPTVTVTVTPPTTGSLKFISATPSNTSITLKGQGGAGRQSYATLLFTMVDFNGKGVANQNICFDATTYAGGLTVDSYNNLALPSDVVTVNATGYITATTPASLLSECGTDNTLAYIKTTDASGNVSVQVNAGTIPTPVRVRARTAYPTISTTPLLETLSDVLTISTGLPVDKNMDLAVDVSNIDGRNFSGSTANFTVRLSDLFGNPVADGTQVNFITSGGAICTSGSGGCTTTNGACSCTLTSEAYRPLDGRVVVMAYAIGLPDFIDTLNNFQFSPGDTFYPLGDAFLDANKNGVYDSTPGPNGDNDKCFPYVNGNPCVPFPLNLPSTVLSNGTGVAAGANPNTIYGPVYLRRSLVEFFSGGSGDSPTIIIPSSVTLPVVLTGLPAGSTASCPTSAASVTFALTDGYGNPMAATTALSTLVADSAGASISAAIVTGENAVPNVGPHSPNPLNDYPASPGPGNLPKTTSNLSDPSLFYTTHTVTITSSSPCTAGSPAGVSIQVTSPHGATASACVVTEGQTIGPRSTTACPNPGGNSAFQTYLIPVVYN